jgi:CPA1 family monovalent cation:H+ antiporter
MFTSVVLIFGLFAVIIVLVALAPMLKIPYAILLVLAGIALGFLLGFLPGMPDHTFELAPDLVLLLFLPPLLYASAWTTSWRDFRTNFRVISLLAIGLVLMTMVLVAVVAHYVIPELSWPAAFVLGAIVSPTDAVAATSIAERLGVPRRIITVLEGESLINDATGLVAYRFAVVAVVTGVFSLGTALWQFLFVSIGGVALGLVVGRVLVWIHRRITNASIEISVTLLAPFVAYLPAEVLNVSGVLAVVTAGLYVGRQSHRIFSAQTRLQADAVWDMLVFLLNGAIFLLIGLQLHGILASLGGREVLQLVIFAALVSLTVIVVRVLWVFPASYLPRYFSAKLRERDPYPGWRNVAVVAWTGMRGVVSLAAALALPTITEAGTPFVGRELIIFLTFGVIFATLVVQGFTLPLVIRGLGLSEDGSLQQEESDARLMTCRAAKVRLEELAGEEWAPNEIVDHLRLHYTKKSNQYRKEQQLLAGDDSREERDSRDRQHGRRDPYSVYQRLQLEVLRAQRDAVIQLRDRGDIGDAVLRIIERELDLEEQRIIV